jgi:hypothetical protein
MTRQEAWEHVFQTVQGWVDRMIPEDQSQPVRDGLFWAWEEMADAFDREATAALLEAWAGLSGQGQRAHPGACPACGCLRTRWLDADQQQERPSRPAVVVVPRQVGGARWAAAGGGTGGVIRHRCAW